MVEMPAHLRKRGAFAFRHRRHRHVTAFTGQRHPTIADRDQPRDAKPGAGPEHADRSVGLDFAAADRDLVVRSQMRQRQCLSGEIVDHHEPLKAEPSPQFGNRESPGMVGHPYLVAGNRRRNRDCRLPRAWQSAAPSEIRLDRLAQTGVIGIGQHARMQQRAIGLDQAETSVCAADIRRQAKEFAGAKRSPQTSRARI